MSDDLHDTICTFALKHRISSEGIDYGPRYSDQPQGWETRCECGQTFQHVSPEGTHDQHLIHVYECGWIDGLNMNPEDEDEAQAEYDGRIR